MHYHEKAYSYRLQRKRQIYLCILFAFLCATNMVEISFFAGKSFVDSLIFSLSLGGILSAVIAIVGVIVRNKILIQFYLAYIITTLAICVLYHIFSLDNTAKGKGGVYGLVLLLLTGLMVLLMWAQVFWAMYFLRLITYFEVYHAHPWGVAGLVPTDDLEALLSQLLQQKPKRSQMVELLSFLDSGRETFTFDEFCQLQAVLNRMEREERHRNRNRKKNMRRDPLLSFHGAPLLQEQYSSSNNTLGASSSLLEDGGAYDSSQHNIMRITVTDEEFAAGMVVGGTPDDFGRRGVVNRNV